MILVVVVLVLVPLLVIVLVLLVILVVDEVNRIGYIIYNNVQLKELLIEVQRTASQCIIYSCPSIILGPE